MSGASVSAIRPLVVADSILEVDPATLVFAIDGEEQTTVAGVEPDTTEWVFETTATPEAATYRIVFPGDVEQMLADLNGAGVESYVVPAGGQDFSLTIEGIVTDVPEAIWGSTHDAVQCFASTSTGAANRATDRPTRRFAIVEPLIELTKEADTLAGVYAAGATASFTITAVVPEALTYDSFTSSDSRVTCSIAGQEITCVHDGDLEPGETFTVSVVTGVDADFAGEISNTATVASQSLLPIGDDPENNADVAETTIEQRLGETPGALAFTGSTVGRLVFIATLLMLVGFAFLALRRRKEILA